MNQHEGKYAGMVKIGERGQFVIPKKVRDLLGFKPGDTILVLADEDRGMAIPPKPMIDEVTKKLFGSAGLSGPEEEA